MQQRYQLAIQQAYAIGGFLTECIAQHRSESMPDVPLQHSRGRPKYNSILDIPNGIDDLGASASSLQDQIAIFNTVSKFPLLNYVNEPMSHFVITEVRSAIINLPARIHHTVHVMFPATSMKLTAVQVHTNPWCAMMEVQSSLTKYTIPPLFPVMAMAWL